MNATPTSAPSSQECLINIPERVSAYPDLSKLNVVITEPRNIGGCKLFPVGFKRENSFRIYAFRVTTPPVIGASKQGKDSIVPFERVDIQPNIFQDHGSRQFEDFLDCVEGLVGKIKQVAAELNLSINFDKWISPVKFRDGLLHGMVAKVRNQEIRNVLSNQRNGVKLALELKFCFSSAQYSVMEWDIFTFFFQFFY